METREKRKLSELFGNEQVGRLFVQAPRFSTLM